MFNVLCEVHVDSPALVIHRASIQGPIRTGQICWLQDSVCFSFFFFLLTLLCSPLWHFVLICAHAGQLCDSLPWMFSSQRYRFRVNEWERVMFVTTVKMCMLLCRADCCKTDVTFRVKTINKQDEA